MRKSFNTRVIHDAVYDLYAADGGEIVLSLIYCNNKKFATGFNGIFTYDDIGDLDIGVDPIGLMAKVRVDIVNRAMSEHPALLLAPRESEKFMIGLRVN